MFKFCFHTGKDTLNLLTDDELVTVGDEYFFNEKFDEAIRCYTAALVRTEPVSIEAFGKSYVFYNISIYLEEKSIWYKVLQTASSLLLGNAWFG